ncbi:MAG: fasciclin domain-containing protein [Caldilineaceae bacterium]
MQKFFLHRIIAALIVVALLTSSFATFAESTAFAAPAAQQVRAKEVTGTLPGGEFAQIWLALEPETSGAQVTVISEWDRNNPADQGLNFFILDDQGVRRVGEDSLSTLAIGAGSSNFLLNGPDNVLGASFNAIGLATYTLVVANDSSQDASFTLRATNAFIIDGSGQVTDPNAAVVTDDTAATDEATGDDTTATDEAAADESATTAPAATTAVTSTTATTATTTPAVEATATTTTTASTETPATTTTATTTAVGGPVRATTLSGSLPEQNSQHFLGLQPENRDAQITLRLTFEPQDNSELARRLNFWVLDQAGFTQYLAGSDPSDVAIAAGNRVFRGQDNERVASFRAVGSGSYTVIVYNNATVPGTYELSVDGGTLVDDAGQTNESQSSGTALSTTGTVTATTATTGTAIASTGTTTTTTTSSATRTGEPGGSYTVQSGDTLALIARDIYGNLSLYEELCAFNNIANCNVIEVGDVIQLPTQAQISAGATAPATPTPTPTPQTTAPTTSATPAVTATSNVSDTASSTLTATDTTTDTTESDTSDTTADSTSSTASAETIYGTLVDNGNFTTLVKALDQAGLDSALDGSGELTLFAPTDAAFVALRNQFSLTEAQLLGLPELTDTLRYHVLSGAVRSEDITDGMSATTLQGKAVRFEIDGDTIKINGANIIAADVETANGIIHVIDAVIIPPAD